MPALAPEIMSATPARWPALFGLIEDEEQAVRQATRLDQVAAAWPLALLAQGAGALWLAAMHGLTPALLVFALLVGVAGASTQALLALPPLVAWPIHGRIRLMATAAALIGAGLVPLFREAAQLAEPMRVGCTVALVGAAGLTALAVQPVRAAAFAFVAGLAVAFVPLAGFGLPLLAAAVLLVAVGAAELRLARLDHRVLLAQVAQAGEGRIAAKMIAEFEGHGTGWFWETDRHGRLTYLSAKVAAELGLEGTDAIGRSLTELFRMEAGTAGTERTLAFHLSSRTSFADYSVSAAEGGEDRPAERLSRCWSISGRPVTDELGRFGGFIGSGADLTEMRRSEAEITRLALFDGLTGLANRPRMRRSIEKTLAQIAGTPRTAGLFLMDLDRFKAVNDTLGHQAGDALLKQVAQRLQRGVGDAGLVGRLGGDEFKVLLPEMGARAPLTELARHLIESLSQPYFIADTTVTIGCSIGIAIAPHDGVDAETLVRNADLALYAAKADGRGVHRFYSEDMLAGARNRQQLEDDLRQALATGAFHLCYQPVVSTADARIVGYEALVRWQHPTRGLVSPADFIPVAEECGLIEALGEWVLRTACLEAACWPIPTRVAVNVSPIQFANVRFPALVASALSRAGLAPERLELEITEGVFLDDSQSSDQMFRALKGLGVRLALDDFGTGYSSLGYLRSAPFDKIKIDQSFVRGAAQPGNRNAAIIRAIVTLADTLGMETTAEGVEIEDEIDLVHALGCSHIQGYVYGRPMMAADVQAQLAAEGGYAVASGFKVSRSPRTRLLRSARISIDGVAGDVRIRDISATGAMIDGISIDGAPDGLDLLIELVEDQMFAGEVRWAREGKAGIRFAEPFDLARLSPAQAMRLRRTA